MTYTAAEARQELLDALSEAINQLDVALAALGDAYEHLDDYNADQLEESLFRPVQVAYGRAKRTYSEFAARHGLVERAFADASHGAPSKGVKGFVERAQTALAEVEGIFTRLQDSMMPVEVGDPELRAGLADVRQHLDGILGRARHFVSRLGR